MKFDYDSKTKEYVCPNCDSRYDKYNSLFKHYQRNHSQEVNNDDKTVTVIDSSRDNNDIFNDMSIDRHSDKVENNDLSTETYGETQEKSLTNRKKLALSLMIFTLGMFLLLIAFKRGWFDFLFPERNGGKDGYGHSN